MCLDDRAIGLDAAFTLRYLCKAEGEGGSVANAAKRKMNEYAAILQSQFQDQQPQKKQRQF